MLLLELCNYDPSAIIKNIIAHVRGDDTRLQDCHATVGNAIKSGKASDNDRVVILGHGSVGAHSIIVDPTGKIIEDSFGNRIKEFDPETLETTYYKTKDRDPQSTWTFNPVKVVPVSDLKS